MRAPIRLLLLLLLCALPAVAASFFILKISMVSGMAWRIQTGSVVVLLIVAFCFAHLRIRPDEKLIAVAGALGLVLCALPLLNSVAAPVRWVRIGGLALYIAPVVIPALLALAARVASEPAGENVPARAARKMQASNLLLAALAWVLAIQPDLAQTLALSVAALLLVSCMRMTAGVKIALALPFLLACVWAALQPDPLEPVPHVEQVIRLAWTHSIWAGLWLSGAAFLLVAGPAWLLGRRHAVWLAIPAYFAMLIVGSLLGITPAPLMGYGAGPLLGYGLMAGLAAALLAQESKPS